MTERPFPEIDSVRLITMPAPRYDPLHSAMMFVLGAITVLGTVLLWQSEYGPDPAPVYLAGYSEPSLQASPVASWTATPTPIGYPTFSPTPNYVIVIEATPTPRPQRATDVPMATLTPYPACPVSTGRMCWPATQTPTAIPTPTTVPTCEATPDSANPWRGCIWTRANPTVTPNISTPSPNTQGGQ